VAIGSRFEHVTNQEDRAAEIAEHGHAASGVSRADRVANAAFIGAELAVGGAARVLDPHPRARHLAGQVCEPTCELGAV
jgi:hypothetical protein